MENKEKSITSENKKNSLVKKGLSLSVLTLFSRILGLIREMTKAKFLGTSSLSDAFGVAFLIPNLCRRLFAENSVSVAFIPTFKSYLEDADTPQGKAKAQDFVNATFTLVTFLVVIFVALGMIFTPWILRIFYSKEVGDILNEATVLTRIMFPYLIVISIAAFFQGILNGIKIFSPSGFTPILFNAIVILFTYILAPHMANPARAMATGVITGGLVQALFQLPFVLKNNWKVTFTSLRNAFTNPGTRKVLALIGPTIIGMACYQLNDVVSSTLATRAGEGVYSGLQYSLRLQELILGIFAVSIGTVILPDLTGFAKREKWQDFNSLLSKSIKIISLIAIPVSFYSYFMGENLIALVFSTGKFNQDSVNLTLVIFRWHIIGLFFIAVNRILAPAFYAQGNTLLPTIAGIIGFAVNIAVAVILVNFGYFSKSAMLKGEGIALSLSISSAVNMIMLFIFFKNTKNTNVSCVIKESIFYVFKMIIFSAIALIPVILFKDKILALFAGHNRFISQGLPVVLTALIFAFIGILLLVITRDSLLDGIFNKLKKRK
jgi:putative peptidoglycan lipid II flippase